MQNQTNDEQIINLLKKEIVPAIGCTEPIAVSLCVAKATEILGVIPEKINVFLSPNVLKNSMGVGIPGTGMIGLPIAIALGALIGKSEYSLEVLKDFKPEDIEPAKKYLNEKQINIQVKENIIEPLYIEIQSFNGKNNSIIVMKNSHTEFSYISKNGNIILNVQNNNSTNNRKNTKEEILNSFRQIYTFVTTINPDNLKFILESAQMNEKAFNTSQEGSYGHNISKTIKSTLGRQILGESILSNMLMHTAGACDVRMDGAMVPVMTNSGSGNQGIAATLPVLIFAKENNNNENELIKALTLSHLTVIYIKQKLGRLSALCGCVAAATGASCGITYLMKGNYEQITFAVKNMIGNITGMICDGAKPSCALKISSGVSTAALSAIMAMENRSVSGIEGIVDSDVDKTIDNLALIGSKGMQNTDKLVLQIMLNK